MDGTTIISETKEIQIATVPPEAPPPLARGLLLEGNWDRLIRGVLYVLVFLLPILFTPWTFEPLEFSKQILLFTLTILAVVLWLLKTLVLRTWRFVKTPLDLPIGVLLVVYFLASIFSVDRIASFLGFYGSFSGNFFQVLFLVLLYYLVVNHFHTPKQLRRLVGSFFFAGLLALLYAVLQFFGLFVFRFSFAKAENFNSIGNLLLLSLYAGFVAVLGLATRSRSWFNWPSGRAFVILAQVAALVILLAVNFLYAWASLLVGLLIYLVFSVGFSQTSAFKNFVIPLVLLIVVISLLVIQLVFPFISPRGLFGFNLPIEVRLDYTTARPALQGVLTERPVLGLGPNTFLYAFSKHRDPAFNLSPFWNVRFDKAPSEAAEYFAGTGLVGFLAFEILSLVFIFYALFFLMQKRGEGAWNLALAIFASFAVLWFAHWFFFFNTVMATSFWLFIASFMTLTSIMGADRMKTTSFSFAQSPRQTVSIVSGLSLGLILVIVFLFFFLSVYAADIFYRRGLGLSNQTESFPQASAYFERAIRLNRFRPDYFLTFSEFLFLRINQELTKGEPNLGLVQTWLATSINTSREAVNLSPNNWTAWERLANLYTSARPLVADVDRFIIESLKRATQNDSKNPILYTELGQVHRLAARRIDPGILGRGLDGDFDGLSDEQERVVGSNPDNRDTNGNNILDGNEVLAGLNPAGSGNLPDSFLSQYLKTDQESLVEAEKAFRRAVELKPDYATAYYQLGLTLEQAGRAEQAIAEFEQALRRFPGNVTLKFDLGRLYFNSGKIEEAARQFQEIVALVPNHANAHYSLALSYARMGMPERVLAEYRKVLALNPDNQEIQQRVRELEEFLSREKK